MTTALIVRDGDEDVSEGPGGREIALSVTVVLAVGIAGNETPDVLGTKVNAAYTQALLALIADRTLGGRVGDIDEGAFRTEFATEGAPAATAELDLLLRYRATGDPAQREAICAALSAQLADNAAAPLGRRELVLAGFLTHVATGLGEGIARNRLRQQHPGTIVFLDGHQVPVASYTGETVYAAEPRLRIVVTAADPADLGTVLNARVAAVRAVVLAGTRRLGGLVDDIRDGDLEGNQALEAVIVTASPSAPTMVADLPFTLVYATADDDPTAAVAG